MIANILAIIFLLKLSSKTHLNAHSFVASHYRNGTKLLLRQLETVLRKVAKRQAVMLSFYKYALPIGLCLNFLDLNFTRKREKKAED